MHIYTYKHSYPRITIYTDLKYTHNTKMLRENSNKVQIVIICTHTYTDISTTEGWWDSSRERGPRPGKGRTAQNINLLTRCLPPPNHHPQSPASNK